MNHLGRSCFQIFGKASPGLKIGEIRAWGLQTLPSGVARFNRIAGKEIGRTMKKLGVVLFGLVLLLAQPLSAQNLAPTLPDQGTVQYAYNSPGQLVKASWNGVYVGPYDGTLLAIGADPTNTPISIYCVDFLHYALPGKTVTASVSNLGGGNTSLTRLGASSLASYQKAAFLASMFQAYTSVTQFSALTQAQAWSGIHAAIWYFTSGGGPYTGDSYWNSFKTYAEDNYQGYAGYNEWSVLTTKSVANSRLQDSQEFLVQSQVLRTVSEVPPTVTPEPQTYVLLATGLFFLVFIGRRRLKEMGYA
jgi:hypothetical protein